MTVALLVGPGVVIGAFVMLYATTLLDHLTLAPTFHGAEPNAALLDHTTNAVAGELVGLPATPTNYRA